MEVFAAVFSPSLSSFDFWKSSCDGAGVVVVVDDAEADAGTVGAVIGRCCGSGSGGEGGDSWRGSFQLSCKIESHADAESSDEIGREICFVCGRCDEIVFDGISEGRAGGVGSSSQGEGITGAAFAVDALDRCWDSFVGGASFPPFLFFLENSSSSFVSGSG